MVPLRSGVSVAVPLHAAPTALLVRQMAPTPIVVAQVAMAYGCAGTDGTPRRASLGWLRRLIRRMCDRFIRPGAVSGADAAALLRDFVGSGALGVDLVARVAWRAERGPNGYWADLWRQARAWPVSLDEVEAASDAFPACDAIASIFIARILQAGRLAPRRPPRLVRGRRGLVIRRRPGGRARGRAGAPPASPRPGRAG